jgi:hypothetical protein
VCWRGRRALCMSKWSCNTVCVLCVVRTHMDTRNVIRCSPSPSTPSSPCLNPSFATSRSCSFTPCIYAWIGACTGVCLSACVSEESLSRQDTKHANVFHKCFISVRSTPNHCVRNSTFAGTPCNKAPLNAMCLFNLGNCEGHVACTSAYSKSARMRVHVCMCQ